MGTRTASPRGHFGGTPSVWPVSKVHVETRQWTWHWPMTCYWCDHEYKRAPVEHVISFFRSRLFVCACVTGRKKKEKKRKESMSERSFKRCVPPCERYITPSDSHELCVTCLGAQHARSALEGAGCAHCDRFTVKQLCSRLALFTEDGSQASAPRGAGPAAAEAERRLHSWGSQLDLADELGTGLSLSQSSVASSVALEPDLEARSPVSSDPAYSMLLGRSSSEEIDVLGVEADATSQTTSSSSPAYGELLDVMTCAIARLSLDWSAETQERTSSSRLDERFLAGHKRSAPPSLPLLPELHSELLRSWRNHF